MGIISEETLEHANKTLRHLGYSVSFGKYVHELNDYGSSSREARVYDLHEAFRDKEIDGIFSVVGGFNSNELLPYIDFELIRQNPKFLCGYSDITALQNAIYARTDLVTFSGPHWSTFGMKKYNDQTINWFHSVASTHEDTVIEPINWFTDDRWFIDQDQRNKFISDGWWAIRQGDAQGIAVGGNLSTVNLLQGTEFFPNLAGKILCVEDEETVDITTFWRDLHSLMQVPGASSIKALLIGRFQVQSGVDQKMIADLVDSLPIPSAIPVLANLDFGHTNPLITFPIGGEMAIQSSQETAKILIKGLSVV